MRRTKRVKEWFKENRPDITLKQADFVDTTKAGDVAANFLTANPDVKGLFVVWDAPAMQVASALRAQALDIPITTIDLGNEAGIELAQCGLVKGIAAQQPYDQGVAEAEAAIQGPARQSPRALDRAAGGPRAAAERDPVLQDRVPRRRPA